MKRFLLKPLGLAFLLSLLLAVGMFFGGKDYVKSLDLMYLDKYLQYTPEEYPFTPAIAMVEINNLSTHVLDRWPWDYRKVAKLIKKINEAEPKAVVLTVPLLRDGSPSNQAKLETLLKLYNKLHPAETKDADKPKKKARRRRRRRRRRRLSARQRARLAQQKALKKTIEKLRKELEEETKQPGIKALIEELKKTKNLVIGYRYYKKQTDVPGVDVPYFQRRDLQIKRASVIKDKKKDKVMIDKLFRPLSKARFMAGAGSLEPALDVYGLRGNPKLAPLAKYHGFVNIPYKEQEVVRSLPLFVRKADRTFPSVALAAFMAYKGTEPPRLVGESGYISVEVTGKEFPLTPDGQLWLNYYGARKRIAPKQRLLAGDVIAGKDYQPKLLKGKVVMVGLSSGLRDKRYNTPIGEAYTAMELQATLLANLLQRRGIHRAPTQTFMEMGLLIVAALLLGFFMLKLRWMGGLVIAVLIAGGLHALNLTYFFPEGTWYQLAYIDASLLIVWFMANWIRDITSGKMRTNTIARFEERLNPEDFSKVIYDPAKLPMDGVRRAVSVVSGKATQLGTAISDDHDPKQLVSLLRHVNGPMVDVIRRNKGMVHQLDGHSVQAFFNAPLEHANHAELACMSALQLQFEWDSFVPRWQQENLPYPMLSLGLDTGAGIVGNFGGDNRFVYSYLGGPLEYSELLQEMNRYYGSRILISESLYLMIQENPQFLVREIDKVELEEDGPVLTLYELLGTSNTQAQLVDLINWYAQALQFYRSRNFQEAARYFQEIVKVRPNDGPAKTMLQRSQHYLNYPPNFQWDGAWRLPSGGGN